jgi:hypothetical protein
MPSFRRFLHSSLMHSGLAFEPRAYDSRAGGPAQFGAADLSKLSARHRRYGHGAGRAFQPPHGEEDG